MDWVIRFLIGGAVVSLFATAGDVLRPKGFAGLFGAAPSVALATLALTVLEKGTRYAQIEARSMLLGALALFTYAIGCIYLMGVRHVRASVASVAMLLLWIAIAATLRFTVMG